jgi:hypothetical protein
MWKKLIIQLAFEAVVRLLAEVARRKGRANLANEIEDIAKEVKP